MADSIQVTRLYHSAGGNLGRTHSTHRQASWTLRHAIRYAVAKAAISRTNKGKKITLFQIAKAVEVEQPQRNAIILMKQQYHRREGLGKRQTMPLCAKVRQGSLEDNE